MNEQNTHLLEEGFEEIANKGVKSFTVDSFSKRLHISKKTIYKFFPNKEKLVRSIIHFLFDRSWK